MNAPFACGPEEVSGPESAQAGAVSFLASPAAHGGVVPAHVVTHISHIFLAGDTALKLMRARKLPFVDYASVASREAFCRREVAVNRWFAPELYRGARPVTLQHGRYALDGPGEIVDWVVEMNRFASGAQLDVMLDRGEVDGVLIDAVADMIARTHAAAPVRREDRHGEAVEALRRQLDRDVVTRLAAGTARADGALWLHLAAVEGLRHRALLDRRGRHGFVRRCHGDLHLSNICLWEGRPLPFDALEFSEAMATIDVLYDLAFVLVDLEQHGRADLALRLLSRYLGRSRDYGGLALLPLFKSCRSMVRALVAVSKGREPDAHVAAARRSLEVRPAPRLVAIGGLSGTGKTCLARALAPRLEAVVIRSDTVHKQLCGVEPEVHLPASAYDQPTHDRVYRRMLVDARRALRAGAPVVLDATFADAAWRTRAGDLAAAAGVPFDAIWLEAPVEDLRARVAARRGDASDADTAVVEAQARAGASPSDWPHVDARGAPDAVAQRALARIAPS